MTPEEFRAGLETLGIESISEFCRETGFYRRTVQRWLSEHGVPLIAQHMMTAWLKLHAAGLDWRPEREDLPATRRDGDALVHKANRVSRKKSGAVTVVRPGPRKRVLNPAETGGREAA